MRKNYPTAGAVTNFGLYPIGLILALSVSLGLPSTSLLTSVEAAQRTKGAPVRDGNDKPVENKSADKSDKAAAKTPEPPIENVVGVNSNELVDKPHDYLNKNVKFTAKFFAFSSLALDYKPAMRPSKTHLSFLVTRPESHVPYSELKLAMAIPKEKDPESQVLTSLKDGDQIEIVGRVFATPLDEPWVDVLRLKKLASAPEEKKDDKKVSSNPQSESKETMTGTEVPLSNEKEKDKEKDKDKDDKSDHNKSKSDTPSEE